MKTVLSILGLLFLINCSDNSINPKLTTTDDVDLKEIEKTITDSLYPVKVTKKGNGILLNMQTPMPEIYYESKLSIIFEKVVLLTKTKINDFDTLWINFDVKESNGEQMIRFYDKKTFLGVIEFNSKNKMYCDFNAYILKHLDGEKLAHLSKYLKILKHVDSTVPTDYIVLLNDYIDERHGYTKGTHAADILTALKKVIVDGKEWPNFSLKDVDYFLLYK